MIRRTNRDDKNVAVQLNLLKVLGHAIIRDLSAKVLKSQGIDVGRMK